MEDLEQQDRDNFASDENVYREVTSTTSTPPSPADSIVKIKSGDHLFLEDESLFKPVPSLKSKQGLTDRFSPPAPEEKREARPEKESADSVKDYLAEIDEQYFGSPRGKEFKT
jgi:hypothetical protein